MTDPRHVALALAAEYAYGARVPGDFIEFGTKSGESAVPLINVMLEMPEQVPDFPERKTLWLCDSFMGFPRSLNPVDAGAPIVASGVWGEGMSRGCAAAALKQSMTKRVGGRISWRIVEGWYKDTWPEFAVGGYALIHADCDLYQSTCDALDPLFHGGCVSPGCIVLFDDWNANAAARDLGQRRAWSDLVNAYEIEASDEGGYGAYSHKFIVHSYSGAS